MEIKIMNKSDLKNPEYGREGDSGLDLRANIYTPITVKPYQRLMIPTGIHLQIPRGYEGQVRGRSGLALKHGIGIVQGIGTIDSNYTGDIGVVIVNYSSKDFIVERGMRIAQLVICKVEEVTLTNVDSLDETNRGEEGYGSSGMI